MIYIIEIEPPLAHARFYLGYAKDVEKRLSKHLSGQGADIIRAAIERHRNLRLVVLMEGDRETEAKYKRQKSNRRIVERYRNENRLIYSPSSQTNLG